MTMFLEQGSPIPSSKNIEKRAALESPLSEEIRQRAARWRADIREACPQPPVGEEPEPNNETEVQKPQPQTQPHQRSRRKSDRFSNSPRRPVSTNGEKGSFSSPKKRGGRLRYSNSLSAEHAESWHPSTQRGNQGEVLEELNSPQSELGSSNPRRSLRKTHSVPSLAAAVTTRPKASSRSRRNVFHCSDEEEGTQSPSRRKAGLELNLKTISKGGQRTSQILGTNIAGDSIIDDSSRPQAERRISPMSPNKSANAAEMPRSKLDDFLDALIFDARKSKLDSTRSLDPGQSKPRKSRSTRLSIGSDDIKKSTSARALTSGLSSRTAVSTLPGERVSLTFIKTDQQQDQRRSQLDPPQVIGRKKSKLSKGDKASRRGKDPPGKVKKTKAPTLGNFPDDRRSNGDRDAGEAATVALDDTSTRETGSKQRKLKGDRGNTEANILDALLSPRRGVSSRHLGSASKRTAGDDGLIMTLKRANSMSVVGRDDSVDYVSSNILHAEPTKKKKDPSGPALSSFLDRRRPTQAGKSGANTVAGDRVALRGSHSMNRSTREVLQRLEAEEKGSSGKSYPESMHSDHCRREQKGDSWRPRRTLSNAGVESSSVERRMKLPRMQSVPAFVHSSAGSGVSDAIGDNERMLVRTSDPLMTFAEDTSDANGTSVDADLDDLSRSSRNDRGVSSSGDRMSGRNAQAKSGYTPFSSTEDEEKDNRPRSAKDGSRMFQTEDGITETDAGVRRPRANSNADEPHDFNSKPQNRRSLMKKMVSSPSLGRPDDDLGVEKSDHRKKRGLKSGRRSTRVVSSGDENFASPSGSETSKLTSFRTTAANQSPGAGGVYVRADGKKVIKVQRKPIDGEILARPDGSKVRIRRKSRSNKVTPVEHNSSDSQHVNKKSWLDQYLDGEELPMASGHSRPVQRSISGDGSSLQLSLRSFNMEGAIDGSSQKPRSFRGSRKFDHINNSDHKLSSPQGLRKTATADSAETKPLSSKRLRRSNNSDSDSGAEELQAKRAAESPLSTREKRKLFRRMNSVPALPATSPLLNLYDKSQTENKERSRRALEAPQSPRQEGWTTEIDSEPQLARRPRNVQGGSGTGHVESSDKKTSKKLKKDGASIGSGDESFDDDHFDDSVDGDKGEESARNHSPIRYPNNKEDAEAKKLRLLQNSDMLRKAKSLSNLGYRQYDAADKLMLVERLRSLNNDHGVSGLRPKPKADLSRAELSTTTKDKVLKDGGLFDEKIPIIDAKQPESSLSSTSRSRLRKVSSHSDVSSLTELSRGMPRAKKSHMSRWTSDPVETSTEAPVKSPERKLSGSGSGRVARNYLLKNAIPSIDLPVDKSPDDDISPGRPSSGRTMNSGSATGSKKEAPPGQPTRKQSIQPEVAVPESEGSHLADKQLPPSMPRRKLSSQPGGAGGIPPKGKETVAPKLPNVLESPMVSDTRPSLLTLGPPESPFRRSLSRWSSVPKDLGSSDSKSLLKDESKEGRRSIAKAEDKESDGRVSRVKPATPRIENERIRSNEESPRKISESGAQFPAPGSQLIVYDDGGSVCSDITDCWTHEAMSSWLAAETRRRGAGHNRRGTYDLGSIINEEGVGSSAFAAVSSSRFDELRSPLQRSRWESSSNLTKELDESIPHPKRPVDALEAKREEGSTRFGWLKKFAFPRAKLALNDESDQEGLLHAESGDKD